MPLKDDFNYNVLLAAEVTARIAGDIANELPSGIILMWSGSIASIPSGWYLCNGVNGTPDLRDRFIAGAGGTYAPATIGGENAHTLTNAQIPIHYHDATHNHDDVSSGNVSNDHTHSFTTYDETIDHHHAFPYNVNTNASTSWTIMLRQYAQQGVDSGIMGGITANHNHSGTTGGITVNHSHLVSTPTRTMNTGNSGSGGSHENRPLFYAICFIMKI